MFKRSIVPALAAALFTVVSISAAAPDAYAEPLVVTGRLDPAPTRAVRHADLNLRSQAGRQQLDTRVTAAVRSLCGNPRALALRERADGRACRAKAWNSAAPQIAAVIAAQQRGARSMEMASISIR